jgi:DNA-binding transcriptional MerR regulator
MPSNLAIEKRYFTITEVADQLGVNPSMLRYWEKEFRQLHPRTNARGKRFYTARDIEVIRRIHELVKVRAYTIEGARRLLNGEIPHDDLVPPPTHEVQDFESSVVALSPQDAPMAPGTALPVTELCDRLEQVRATLLEWKEIAETRSASPR